MRKAATGYTYRMKSHGRCWSRAGGLAMIKVITGLKNGNLERAMVSKLEGFRSKPGKDFSKAVKMALKKIPFRHGSVHWPHSQLWAEQQPDGASGAGLSNT